MHIARQALREGGRFYPSSKRCSNCGYKQDVLMRTCPECGMHHDRDENVTKNLEREGRNNLQEDRNIRIIKSSTVGTTGIQAPGDHVRRFKTTAVIAEEEFSLFSLI